MFNKKLQLFTVGDIDYFINSGVFILNKAFSLFHNNSNLTIDGFILDTTWRAIPNYVTSILNVCFKNSSLPIAFAFGSGETIYLYDLLLQTVQDHLNIEFEGKYLESDEGSALHSICDKYSMIQLSCLRHFLEKLKKLDYFYEVKQLLKCTSQFEFENCLQIFSDHFTTICTENPEEFTKINKILLKVGLFFLDGQITIQNLNKWKKVSLLSRVDACMPSTTNTLEAMHGHINESCPRRNTFFSSMYRLISEMETKYQNISQRIKHNYNYTKNSTMKMLQNTDLTEMQKMISFYQTENGHCTCGQNKLQSSNYKIDIPCVHRLAIGDQFPILLPLFLNLQIQHTHLSIDYAISQNLYFPQRTHNEKQFVIETIKHFNRYKKIEDIQNFIDSHNYNDTDGFYINNQPAASIKIIEEGIYFFKKLKEVEQKNN